MNTVHIFFTSLLKYNVKTVEREIIASRPPTCGPELNLVHSCRTDETFLKQRMVWIQAVLNMLVE